MSAEKVPELKFRIGVILARATGLKAMDINGKSDPYVKLIVSPGRLDLPDMKTSKVVKKTLNPEWWETFEFEYTEEWIGSKSHSPCLVLEVWDQDRIGKDEFIGGAKVRLGDLFKPVFRLLKYHKLLVGGQDDYYTNHGYGEAELELDGTSGMSGTAEIHDKNGKPTGTVEFGICVQTEEKYESIKESLEMQLRSGDDGSGSD